MSEIKQSGVHSLKKGSYIMVDGAACVVRSIQISRPGKHGHAKARIEAVGIIDEKKRIFVKPGDGRVDVPIIGKKNAQIISLNKSSEKIEGQLKETVVANCMDLESFETFDVNVPQELWETVTEGSSVLYWDVVGSKLIQRLS